MMYTLNDYYKYTDSTTTRMVVYLANETAASLLAHHKRNGIEIPIGGCVDENAATLPMPNPLMKALDEKIHAANKRVVVTGIDAYLSLISRKNSSTFMAELHRRVDASKLNAIYLLHNTHFDKQLFQNPKYENSLSVVRIDGEGQHFAPIKVVLISDRWVQTANHPRSWNALLANLGQFEPTGVHTLLLDNFSNTQAGLSDSVLQLLDISEIAEQYYNLTADLPKSVLESLIVKSKDSNIAPLDFIKAEFKQENINTRLALKRLVELKDNTMWTAYVWMLQKNMGSLSYLTQVIGGNITPDTLLQQYVSDTAVTLLSCGNADKYAAERAAAIRELGNLAAPLIINFIGRTRGASNEDVACWLNCGTEAERAEIVRRVSESDLTNGLPQIWRSVYPTLADYLSDDYAYTNEALTEYFRDYRRFKIANTVTRAFVQKAFDFALSPTFITRDSVLQELSVDSTTALLVADGMGAEYFPLIQAMARRREINIESAVIASARLPSSTEFNRIEWNDARYLKPHIHEIDNISHDGAEKHEKCSFEQNTAAVLFAFDAVFNRIASGLEKYARVVLTSDHGSSRLAVIAHNKKLDTDLEWNGEVHDQRYTIALTNAERPPAFEACYNAENELTYWVVRGYNRLPKRGKPSIHGGATLEERLVPVIVFTRTEMETAQKGADKKVAPQLVEKTDFNEI